MNLNIENSVSGKLNVFRTLQTYITNEMSYATWPQKKKKANLLEVWECQIFESDVNRIKIDCKPQ